MRFWGVWVGVTLLAGCGARSGVFAVGPDTWAVSEMRAPALGGGAEAQRVVVADMGAFCAAQGRTPVTLALRPDGDPFTPYYPTAFSATFRCAPPAAR